MPKRRSHNTIPSTIPVVAYMHEGTVQDIADGKIQPMKKERKPATKTHSIGHIKIDPRIWAVVLRVSHGDMRRVEVRSAKEVVVHNNHEWRKRSNV